jgi:citrate lyase subunit beta/citryl-CoA lyase
MLAARAAGVLPMGFIGSIAEYRDREKFRARIQQAARLGFLGSACIHPLQVDILNEEFTPTGEAVEQSRAIIAAYDEAKAAGRGSIEYDSKMIDEPIVQRAEQLLARAAQIQARSS